ncbi:hypothetical protein ACFPYJ_29195 [Paenibacillus solisilvae]|uniref:Alpha/beta hydrolase n=1 Tax=Paenibacillus solisilvae TaxID=2486751 RepID=A0ABW0W4K4_9BACL
MGNEHVSMYLLSGLATAPHFMDSFRLALHRMIEKKAASVHSELLFPYGDWSRRVIPQLREIGHDLRLGVSRYGRSIGGKRAIEAVQARQRSGHADRGRTIWIGHSGGGVAAVHAAGMQLEREGGMPSPSVLIGSPKFRIRQELRHSVLYVYAAADEAAPGRGSSVKTADRISRLGTFGGWTANNQWLPSWSVDKYAPQAACGVPIIGGHPDYFREQEPFINSHGLSNQWLTLQAIWSWLEERI